MVFCLGIKEMSQILLLYFVQDMLLTALELQTIMNLLFGKDELVQKGISRFLVFFMLHVDVHKKLQEKYDKCTYISENENSKFSL